MMFLVHNTIKLEHFREICEIEYKNGHTLCKELPMIFQNDGVSFHINGQRHYFQVI